MGNTRPDPKKEKILEEFDKAYRVNKDINSFNEINKNLAEKFGLSLRYIRVLRSSWNKSKGINVKNIIYQDEDPFAAKWEQENNNTVDMKKVQTREKFIFNTERLFMRG